MQCKAIHTNRCRWLVVVLLLTPPTPTCCDIREKVHRAQDFVGCACQSISAINTPSTILICLLLHTLHTNHHSQRYTHMQYSKMSSSQSITEQHLGWSHKQGRILTANGLADGFYTAEQGFPFIEEDLPHYHLQRGDTRPVFRAWSQSQHPFDELNPIFGAWNRLLFTGGFEHSSSETERVFNVQTNTLFVDLRIPHSRSLVLSKDCTSLASLSDEELRLFARQHVFGGYSRLAREPPNNRLVCTRHHCMDWNYVGVSRSRPNKWWVEMNSCGNVWKEWAYAKDHFCQHYYMERWERYDQGSSNAFRLALRKRDGSDGIVVVVGVSFKMPNNMHVCLAHGT